MKKPAHLTEKQKAAILRAEERKIATARKNASAERAKAERLAENKAMEERGLTVVADAMGFRSSVTRHDCFTLLLKDRVPSHKAVGWLETLIRTAAGENGQERRPDFIRATTDGAPGQNITADMIAASEVLTVVEENLRPWEARLLFELLRPDAALLTRWRDAVARLTGETNPQAQGAAVRAAAASLAWVRENIERLQRERRSRRLAA